MLFQYRGLLDLTKRAAAFQKGLSLAGAGAEQRSYGLLTAEPEDTETSASLSYIVRGPYGWLAQSLEADPDSPLDGTGFEFGADPASLQARIAEIYGRDAVDLSTEVRDDRTYRVVIEGEDYSRRLPLDPISGLTAEAHVPFPEIDPEQALHSTTLQVSQLAEVLKFALHAAPSSETQPQRAVITLEFAEDEIRGLATDGRLIMCVRGSATTPADHPWQIHLGTEAGNRLLGLLSTVPDQTGVNLDVCPGAGTGEEADHGSSDSSSNTPLLMVSFSDDPITALIPLPITEGLPVAQILDSCTERTPMATIVVTPRTVNDIKAVGVERAIVFESTRHGLRVWSRIDSDDAGDERLASAEVPATECSPCQLAVDSNVVAKLIAMLNGDTLALQATTAGRGTGLLLVEQVSESEVSVLAGLVGLAIG